MSLTPGFVCVVVYGVKIPDFRSCRFIPVIAFLGFWSSFAAPDRPNILWLTSEDHGPQMGCYGDALARTPNVDALASRGMLFNHVWSNQPVCASARTTIITGLYATSTGGLHMRSMVPMPVGTKLFPQYLREAGYYCSNNNKEDYNVPTATGTWDNSSGTAHWSGRREGQPFFAVFNSGKSHESQIRTRPHVAVCDPARIRLPVYHPDTPDVRQDWAQYYDKISEADADAGERLRELENAGLAPETIVFYYADHGGGMPRSKRWPSNSGLHVPLVVYFPPKWRHLAPREYQPGGKSDRLVSFVDLAPTMLSLVGLRPPAWMQGHAFAGPHQAPRQPFLFGSRGRMDERMDSVRSVTDGRYVYLRNFYPHVSQGQQVEYQFQTPTTRIWRRLFDEGRTTPAQSIFWQVPKAPEELYDLHSDPDEVRNLAGSPQHRAVLEKLQKALGGHVAEVRDVCFLPEHEMHSRSRGGAPYDLARDAGKYPLRRIYDAADIASRLDSGDLGKLTALITDTDSAVRHWASLGFLARGREAVTAGQLSLQKALADPAPDVRIVAAQALAQFGPESSLTAALAVLRAHLSPKENGALVAMSALAAVEALGAKADSLHGTIRTLEPKGPSPDPRFDSYVPRLIQHIMAKPNQKTVAPVEPGAEAVKPGVTSATGPRNILFLIADDLNNLLGCYGDPLARTPNLDKLAARGVRFDRAYCTFPLCGPSRNSLLTGLYPNSTGILTNSQIFRQTIPSHISLPQAFRQQGHFAARIGKLYHYNVPNSIGTDGHDDPASWELELNPAGIDRLEEHPKIFTLTPGQFGATLSWYASPKGEAWHTDAMLADGAEWVLERCAQRKDRPFFLAVGFFRPHTPYVAPRSPYFDYHDKSAMPVVQGVLADQADLPAAALGSLRQEEERLTDDLRRQARQAYQASISFMDAQVGKVVDALDRLGLSDSTVIVFTSDHGYHLGEHGLWQKRSLFEESARVPLIVVAPGISKRGTIVETPVSHIDLYPTLAEVAAVKSPTMLQGQSLVPMLKNPSSTGRGWALTQVARDGALGALPGLETSAPSAKGYFGYSLRTVRWRYTEWDEGARGRELYDHDADPKELRNLAAVSGQEGIMAELSVQLRAAVASSFPTSGATPELKPGIWAPLVVAP